MPVASILPKQLAELRLNTPGLRIVDVRTPAEFARVHAAGAVSLPLDQLNAADFTQRMAGDDSPIYVICQSGGRSALACQRLHDAGVKNAISVEGGTTAWEAAGLPVQRGAGGAIALERQVRIAAGALVLTGVVLASLVSAKFIWLSGAVGGGLVFAGITDYCGMGLLLAKMPWNTAKPRPNSSD